MMLRPGKGRRRELLCALAPLQSSLNHHSPRQQHKLKQPNEAGDVHIVIFQESSSRRGNVIVLKLQLYQQSPNERRISSRQIQEHHHHRHQQQHRRRHRRSSGGASLHQQQRKMKEQKCVLVRRGGENYRHHGFVYVSVNVSVYFEEPIRILIGKVKFKGKVNSHFPLNPLNAFSIRII